MSTSQNQRPLYEIKAGLFKGLSHPLRIRILELLSAADERSVADLQSATGLEASHLSQHLAVLRRHRLVESERRASSVYYRLAYPEVAELLTVARRLLLNVVAADAGRARDAASLPPLGPGA
ncbi:metalloregulator ArsR/SmtB family transcription factor [uncultured Microbacterium sp.]|uniref:ArsR/SmtB family transcription factor n=1 Tax=uncultured Microbacterium sp. TaxID=191216 RepID=UPI0028D5E3BE|nr:metalloregulator ArsR/SmtB family transcription factor [uncultured Microbacterium sp.]